MTLESGGGLANMSESYREKIEDERRRKWWRNAHAKCARNCGPNPNWGEGHKGGCPIGDAQAEAQQEEMDQCTET